MQIARGQKIAGQRATILRDALRHLRDGSWGSESLGFYLKVSPGRAKRIIASLAKLGYIERDGLLNDRDAWCLTDAGRALTNANALRPLHRGIAKGLIAEFLDRVHEVNSNPSYLYRVSKVILFGSYLSTKDTIGDIDLAIQLDPKEPNQERFGRLVMEHSKEAARAGRRFSTFIDELAWADTEVRRFLKGKSRYLSLHSTSDGVLKTCDKRLIFPVRRKQHS